MLKKAFAITILVLIALVTILYIAGRMDVLNNIQASIATIPQHISAFWVQLQTYGVTPMQLLSAVGGVATVGGLIIAKLRSSLKQTKQKADEQISGISNEAFRTQTAMNETIKTQQNQIQELTKKVSCYEEANSPSYKSQLDEKTRELEKLRGEFNLLERLKFPERVVVKEVL